MKWNPDMSSYFLMQRVSVQKFLYSTNRMLMPRVNQDIGKLVVKICNQDRSEWPKVDHPTFFHELLDSKLPQSEKTIPRLAQEGGFLLGAGTVTTSWSLTTGVFWLLREPEVLRKLKQELVESVPVDLVLEDGQSLLGILETLPYMQATVQEMIRMGTGVATRSARVAPDEDLAVPGTDFVIPRNTAISMSHLLMNRDSHIFPDPNRFRPERWIENPDLARWQVTFGKGSRFCLGKDLNMSESYLLLAYMFRTYGTREVRFPDDIGYIELYETDEADIECAVDGVLARPRLDSKGVRCRVWGW
jgi:cytochrome P450